MIIIFSIELLVLISALRRFNRVFTNDRTTKRIVKTPKTIVTTKRSNWKYICWPVTILLNKAKSIGIITR